MKKNLYNEVPFSIDYNYDKLTSSEASEVFLTINNMKNRNFVGTVVKYILLLIIPVIGIYLTIFAVDWTEILSYSDYSGKLKVILNIIFIMFIDILGVSLWVREIIFNVKFRKIYNKFLIAKGNIIDVQKTDIQPDYFHPDGVKALLTVAISDSEALPPFDISLHQYDDVVIGDSIIIISFPKISARVYAYLYQPWEQRHE